MASSQIRLRAALVLLSALALAGCTQTNAGQPSTAPVSPTPSASGPATDQPTPSDTGQTKAPKVQQPLDASKFIADPCTSLTKAQLATFKVSRAGEPSGDTGPGCSWRFGTNGDTFASITYQTSVTTGLSNLYGLNDAGHWKDGYFEPTEIAGYPAVYHSILEARPKTCGLSVAATDQLFFQLLVIDRPGADGCAAVKTIAAAVVKTIRAG